MPWFFSFWVGARGELIEKHAFFDLFLLTTIIEKMPFSTQIVGILTSFNYITCAKRFFSFSFIPNLFSSCSHHVPNMFPMFSLCPIVCALAINPNKKWWQIVLKINVSCNLWKGLRCTHDAPSFFGGGVEGVFFASLIPNVFLMCSYRVDMGFPKFPSCSQ